MAEYAQWVIEDMAPFAMYAAAAAVLFVGLVAFAFAAFHIIWIAHTFATIRSNLLADKMEEKAEADFARYCNKLDSERDNG